MPRKSIVFMVKSIVMILVWSGCTSIVSRLSAQTVIEIRNPLQIERNDEVVAVPWHLLEKAFPAIDSSSFSVVDISTGKQVAFQLEYYGQKTIRNVLMEVSVRAGGSLKLRLQKGMATHFAAKTFCRYVPERKDDFAWENDKIAFRAYGKALEHTNENAYGFDVWVKRTPELVIDKRYLGNDYHTDHGDGLDYYQVGYTLGAGGIAPFLYDSIWYSANYHRWKILDNGPLRSTFQLEYDEWIVGARKVQLTLTLSIDAGSQVHRVEALYTSDRQTVLPVAVGIVLRGEQGKAMIDQSRGVAAYWEPTDPQNGTTGVGCVFPATVKKMAIANGHLLTTLNALPGKPLVYYRGAAWDKAGSIVSAEQWKAYLSQQKQKLDHPLQVYVNPAR